MKFCVFRERNCQNCIVALFATKVKSCIKSYGHIPRRKKPRLFFSFSHLFLALFPLSLPSCVFIAICSLLFLGKKKQKSQPIESDMNGCNRKQYDSFRFRLEHIKFCARRIFSDATGCFLCILRWFYSFSRRVNSYKMRVIFALVLRCCFCLIPLIHSYFNRFFIATGASLHTR